MPEHGEVTRLLNELSGGNPAALDQLLPLVYPELRAIAQRYFLRERRDHTLQPTALVHEAYLRLTGQQQVTWHGRLHFLGVAAMLMRRILVDHAREAHAAKRGGGDRKVTLDDDALAVCEQRSVEMIAIDQALTRLAALDPAQSRLVELRFFGGLSIEEAAGVLGVSTPTIKRRWASARAWLYSELHFHEPRSRSGKMVAG